MIIISQPSLMSLRLNMFFDDAPLAIGTGFIAVAESGRPMLITNRHNVTGRDQITNQPLSRTGGVPDRLIIRHNSQSRLGDFVDVSERLYNDAGEALWLEHPVLQGTADFVALPLTSTFGLNLMAYSVANPGPDIAVNPSEAVSVVGYPFGMDGSGMAIWATGFVASELSWPEDSTFLIDCRSRQGQSGSPVIAYRAGGTVSMATGGSRVFGHPVWKFLGIYTGRVNAESDLGYVWKAEKIAELLAAS